MSSVAPSEYYSEQIQLKGPVYTKAQALQETANSKILDADEFMDELNLLETQSSVDRVVTKALDGIEEFEDTEMTHSTSFTRIKQNLMISSSLKRLQNY